MPYNYVAFRLRSTYIIQRLSLYKVQQLLLFLYIKLNIEFTMPNAKALCRLQQCFQISKAFFPERYMHLSNGHYYDGIPEYKTHFVLLFHKVSGSLSYKLQNDKIIFT